MSNLAEKAMLVRLSISQWTARKYDRKVSNDVATMHSAAADAGRYNKLLIAEDAIKEINKLVSEARNYHYTNTLPWHDDGARILPAKNFMQYSSEMRKRRGSFEKAVGSFLANYDTYVETAKARLGGMFKAEDYPDMDRLQTKYGFDVAIEPIPVASDFRVSLQSEDVESIQRSIEDRMVSAQRIAMNDLWNRIHTSVSHMADKLGSSDAIFRDSLVGNLDELVDLLPRLNINEDVDLDQVRQDIARRLCKHSPDTLRQDNRVRKEVAKSAQDILKKMSGYIG